MLPRPPSCEGCPANPTAQGFVAGEGNPAARIALVGQGPGRDEVHAGRPFIGRSGQKLDRWLYKAGLQRTDLWITNVVQCGLPKDRKPTPLEREWCWRTLVGPELTKLGELRVVVPVGVAAMEQFLGKGAREGVAGSVHWVELPSRVDGNRVVKTRS